MKSTLSVFIFIGSLASIAQAQTDVTVANQTYSFGTATVSATRDIATSGTVTANSGATVTFTAGRDINTTGSTVAVNSGSNVTFTGVRKIVLGPGFTASGQFHAQVQPTATDSDGDGIPDYWEYILGLDPYNIADGAADADGDGVSNAVEFMLGLNMFDPTDVNVHTFEYDKVNQLKKGPGAEYNKDAEGNVTEIKP